MYYTNTELDYNQDVGYRRFSNVSIKNVKCYGCNKIFISHTEFELYCGKYCPNAYARHF